LNITHAINDWEHRKETYYKWLVDVSLTTKLLLCLGMAALTGVAAQIRILLPFTPVPITGQVLAVLLAGILLGNLYGGLSMCLYLVMGCAGIPWFSGGVAGLPMGPTAGYILGFIPAALFIGWSTKRFQGKGKFLFLVGLMMIAIFIIYLCGAINFAFYMKTGFIQTISLAVLPFIPIDLIKAFVAAGIARTLLPKRLRR
jgi:biotin transport system substrate-specific component